MVCLGNICRSPLAEGILKSKLPLEHFFVDSAGTSNYHIDELPDNRSIDVAKTHGIDITDQTGRQFVISDFDAFDYIFAMDKSNQANILSLAKSQEDEDKVELFLNLIHLDQDLNVPDPYYGGEQGFEDVYQMLNLACDEFLKNMNNG